MAVIETSLLACGFRLNSGLLPTSLRIIGIRNQPQSSMPCKPAALDLALSLDPPTTLTRPAFKPVTLMDVAILIRDLEKPLCKTRPVRDRAEMISTRSARNCQAKSKS
jgi:hypothetical protein